MTNTLSLEASSPSCLCPDEAELLNGCDHCLIQFGHHTAVLTLRLVDGEEMQRLNHQFRHKNKTTNVLAFPCTMPAGTFSEVLGDLVLCGPVIADEAAQQQKSLRSHWLHLTLHGLLHLLGFNHQTPAQANCMEQQEIQLLKHWGYPNPYQSILLKERTSDE